MAGHRLDSLHVFANMGDGVWAVNKNQRIVFWNCAAEELLGYRAKDVLGRRCWRLLAGREVQGKLVCCHACRILGRARRGEPIQSVNLVVRCHDGGTASINVSTLYMPEADVGDGANSGYLVHLFRVIGAGPELPDGLRIHLLGNTKVVRADLSPICGPLWQRAKVRGLFAVLAAHQGKGVSCRFLIKTFWPDLPVARASHNLHTTVYNLRRSLEPELQQGADSEYIPYRNDQYLLAGAQANWLDVVAFEEGLRRARTMADPQRAVTLYQDALAYYRGDFQLDLGQPWEWHEAERTRLRRLYLAALEELGQRFELLGEDDAASVQYKMVLGLEPCQESACGRHMRLLLRRGDGQTAASSYLQLASALRKELDLEPGSETRQLYERARGGRQSSHLD